MKSNPFFLMSTSRDLLRGGITHFSDDKLKVRSIECIFETSTIKFKFQSNYNCCYDYVVELSVDNKRLPTKNYRECLLKNVEVVNPITAEHDTNIEFELKEYLLNRLVYLNKHFLNI